ncbi:polysaccharide biosynthesis protein [Horticoccus sp. 23ND18S-11]|uniref:polysaccharide biosynthesis protein n=1 Tax=Horticoccus sp. 23ND18S-11 TaxID=3391832 RepID=UPI0039C95B6E
MTPSTRNSFISLAQNQRRIVLTVIYSAIVVVSFYLAYEIRFEFNVPESYQQERWRVLPVVLGVKLIALVAARQLGSLMTYFSIPDLMRLIWAMAASSLVLFAPRMLGWSQWAPPRGVLLTDFMLCLGTLCLNRVVMRIYRERLSGARRAAPGVQEQRIAIVGAGDAGASLAKDFIAWPSRGFRPVMFFDDDVNKHGRLVHGVPVVGRPESIVNVKDTANLAKAVIAMPSASAKRVREVVTLFSQLGLKVETLPSLEELASGRVRASRIRPVEVQDLLGREAINLDSARIRQEITGRRVLVTGAGGSIGGELCRQIAALNPNRLLLVEQSEAALFMVEQELNELGFAGMILPLVGDILDRERMEYIFARYEPEIVFHAAAHKHVFLMERQPAEAIRNNVLGTRLLAQIAVAHQVGAFVLISTDKAINPTSVMGATKRLAELQLMAISALQGQGETDDGRAAGPGPLQGKRRKGARTKMMAVRFGNVLGSSGSVIPIFKRQIANGGPVTVTHPDVTRFFMTIPEAVGLVLQSFVLGADGEIFVLDMGEPVKIVDLARQMIELSGFRVGEDIEITFTGLKPGEKLFEELQHRTEAYAPTAHPRIMRFTSQAMFSESGVQELEKRLYEMDSNQLRALLKRLVPEYTPFLD